MMSVGKLNKIRKYAQKGKTTKLRIYAIYDNNKSVRLAAIDGLSQIADRESAENALMALLADRDSDIRAAAAAALGNARSDYAQVQLSYFCKNEKNETVLSAARSSLTKLDEASL